MSDSYKVALESGALTEDEVILLMKDFISCK